MGALIALLVVVFIVAVVGGLIATVVKSSKVIIDQANTKEEYKADVAANFRHTSGLPIPAGIMVGVYCTKDRLIIKKDSQEITLSVEKLKSVDSVMGKDLQTQTEGALAGGLLFGLSGAVIGALASSTTYLAITYESGGDTKCILLDTVTAPGNAKKVASYYKETIQSKEQKIEL